MCTQIHIRIRINPTATMLVSWVLILCIASSIDAAFIPFFSNKHKDKIRETSCCSFTSIPSLLNISSSRRQSIRTTTGPFLMVADDASNGDVDADNGDGGSTSTSIYQLPPDAGPIAATCQFTEEQIHTLIANRSLAKSQRKFDEADRILDELKLAGVHLHDNRKEWRADGDNHFGRTNGDHKNREFVMRGGTHGLSLDALSDISKIVERRSQAKRTRDFLTYNELGGALKNKFGVHVNDKKREWSMIFITPLDQDQDQELTSVYVPSPIAPLDSPTHAMDDESKATIQKRLTDRLMARRRRNYVLADSIQDDLKKEYLVDIDDRTREWMVGTIDDDGTVDDGTVDDGNVDDGTDATVTLAAIKTDVPAAAIATVTDEEETESQLLALTIIVLKEKLRNAGLPVSGKKAELVERLLDSISNSK